MEQCAVAILVEIEAGVQVNVDEVVGHGAPMDRRNTERAGEPQGEEGKGGRRAQGHKLINHDVVPRRHLSVSPLCSEVLLRCFTSAYFCNDANSVYCFAGV